jgi:hypothetical protein
MKAASVSAIDNGANGRCTARHLRAALLGLMLTMVAASVSAISIRELRALEASDKDQGVLYVQYYLVGAMEGLLEANAHVARSGGKPSICPNGRKLEPRMAKPLYDGELRRNAGLYEADMPAQLVLLNAMVAAYAC